MKLIGFKWLIFYEIEQAKLLEKTDKLSVDKGLVWDSALMRAAQLKAKIIKCGVYSES